MKKQPEVELTELQKIIYDIMKTFGTDVYGEDYRKKLQAQAIDQLFCEIEEVNGYIHQKNFRFVKGLKKR